MRGWHVCQWRSRWNFLVVGAQGLLTLMLRCTFAAPQRLLR